MAVIGIGSIVLLGWWVLQLFKTEYELPGHRAAPHGVVFVDKHGLIATACADLHLYLFSASDGSLLRRIGGHTKRLTSISTFPEADVIATASADGSVKIWSLPRGIEQRSIVAHPEIVLAVRYSLDGSTLASVGNDDAIRVWNPENGQLELEIRSPESNGCLAMNPGGSLIVGSGVRNDLVVWNVDSGSERTRLRGDTPATSACFSSDGMTLAVGREDGRVELWQTGAWQRKSRWHEHRSVITDLAFSTNQRTLFSASGDRTVGVWDLEGGYRVGAIWGGRRQVLSVATSQTGAVAVAVTGYGPSARMWTDASAAIE
jgi:WD40 repeat protein